MRKAELFLALVVAAAFALGAYAYPDMPDKVATHWNAQGAVDGFMEKTAGLFLMPLIILLTSLLLVAIPRVDPLKANIEKFRDYYDGLMAVLCVFLLAVYAQMILWNLGYNANPLEIIPVGVGALFYYVGLVLGKSKRNWFIGIRTPWTLSSDAVWEKTNKLGGRLLQVSSAFAFLGLLLPTYAFLLILVPAIIATVYPIAYSYFEFNREKKQGKGAGSKGKGRGRKR